MRAPRLLLALNRGAYSEVIAYATGSALDGSPILAGTPRSEFAVRQSPLNNESEGLAVTGAGLSPNPLGGVLDWQILPALSPTTLYSRILTYRPALAGFRGVRLTVVARTTDPFLSTLGDLQAHSDVEQLTATRIRASGRL